MLPALGRVSMAPDFGDVAAGMPADCVLTRTVMDTAVALDVIAGYEPGDLHRAWAASQSFVQLATADPGRLQVAGCGVTAPSPGIRGSMPEPAAAAPRAAGELTRRRSATRSRRSISAGRMRRSRPRGARLWPVPAST